MTGVSPSNHSHIDEKVKEKDAQHAITVDPSKTGFLPFGEDDKTENKCHEQEDDNGRTHKSLFFSNGTEDEVGVLFRHIFQFGLGAVEEPFSE